MQTRERFKRSHNCIWNRELTFRSASSGQTTRTGRKKKVCALELENGLKDERKFGEKTMRVIMGHNVNNAWRLDEKWGGGKMKSTQCCLEVICFDQQFSKNLIWRTVEMEEQQSSTSKMAACQLRSSVGDSLRPSSTVITCHRERSRVRRVEGAIERDKAADSIRRTGHLQIVSRDAYAYLSDWRDSWSWIPEWARKNWLIGGVLKSERGLT